MKEIFSGYGIKLDYSSDLNNQDEENKFINKEIFYDILGKSNILNEKWQQFIQSNNIKEEELDAQDLLDIYTEQFSYEPRGIIQCLIILRDVIKEEENLEFTIADIQDLKDLTNTSGSTVMILKKENNKYNLSKESINEVIHKYTDTYLAQDLEYGDFVAIEEY